MCIAGKGSIYSVRCEPRAKQRHHVFSDSSHSHERTTRNIHGGIRTCVTIPSRSRARQSACICRHRRRVSKITCRIWTLCDLRHCHFGGGGWQAWIGITIAAVQTPKSGRFATLSKNSQPRTKLNEPVIKMCGAEQNTTSTAGLLLNLCGRVGCPSYPWCTPHVVYFEIQRLMGG